jgi:hypothetical protein
MEPDADRLDALRDDLTTLVRRLLERAPDDGADRLAPLVRAHLGAEASRLPVLRDTHADFDLPNLQLAIDAMLARPGWSARLHGIAGQGRRGGGLALGDLMTLEHWGVGPPEYENVAVGPGGRTLACLVFATLLLTTPDGPAVMMVRVGGEAFGPGGAALEAVSPAEGLAAALLADIRALMAEVDVFRGEVITVEASPMTGGSTVTFLERPRIEADEVVLPPGLMDRVERHVVAPTRHRDALLAAGRHLGRGLLLWGPPGTGKTLTVRYLIGRLEGVSIIVLSGAALGMVGSFAALARRVAPAVVVLEDVDAVAEERGFGPAGAGTALFELMNDMSGQAGDADVAFILTTNRPDVLEPALAARPGRVDLALEMPLPDADARRRLLRLYARGMDLRLDDEDAVVARTEGVTAAFVKELLRKALLEAAERGSAEVTQADVDAALDELMHETAALTRAILASGPRVRAGDPAHGWLAAFGGDDPGDASPG